MSQFPLTRRIGSLVLLLASPSTVQAYQDCSPVACCNAGPVHCTTALPAEVGSSAVAPQGTSTVSVFVDQYDGGQTLVAAEIRIEFLNSGEVQYTNLTPEPCSGVTWGVDLDFANVHSPTIPNLCASLPLQGGWQRDGAFPTAPPDGTVSAFLTPDGYCDTCTIAQPARIGPVADPVVLAQMSGNGQIEFEASFTGTTSVMSACSPASILFLVDTEFRVSIQYYDCLVPIEYCFGVGCPCGNDDDDAGCANGSFLEGSRLTSSGASSVGDDSFELRVERSTPNQPGLFFQGDIAINGGQGVSFGDGLRCAGNNVVRLQPRTADGNGTAHSTVEIADVGGVSVGDVKRYQWWYRDPSLSLCGHGFVLSNGLEVSWAP